jgi:hypothetical protein
MADPLEGRCATCARFVRVIETIDETGEVRRAGECLLAVWPSPLYETSTCSQWVRRGEFRARPLPPTRAARGTTPARAAPPVPALLIVRRAGGRTGEPVQGETRSLPEDLTDMDASEFKRVLAEVIREELGVAPVEMAGRWEGGEMVLIPGKEGLQERRIPVESLFHKIVMIRDKLRVLEQKINSHPKLGDDEKLQLQQYITGCYGSLTTFNVLFANRDDTFVGQKGDS